MALLTSAAFLWSSLLAAPISVLAQTSRKPIFPASKPLPAPLVHDDPAWHTIDYHAQEHARPSVLSRPSARSGKTPHAPLRAPTLTLLDEVGRLASPVQAGTVADWKRKLHHPRLLSSAQTARLHLWLGEYALAHEEQPAQALWHFAQAQTLSRRKEALYGLAAYDAAVALFYEGAYSQAQAAFRQVLTAKPGLHGFDRAGCALFRRHALACAGYHAERAKLGIPEPPRLDPLCGAAGLAQALKAAGKPYDKKTVLAHLRVTGRGSTLGDVMAGAQKLGLTGRIVSADEAGLIALPKPLVAYVEHDHFVSVVHADKRGVAYLCADCGGWPGGRIDLTWAQWRKMEATLYGVIQRPGSEAAQALSLLEDKQSGKAAGVRLASSRPSALRLPPLPTALLRRLDRHVNVLCGQGGPIIAWPLRGNNVAEAGCGQAFSGQKCYNYQCCADDAPDSGGEGGGVGVGGGVGPSWGDPVNLATGEEEYRPAPDLAVYNPIGPSVAFARQYDSLRPTNNAADGYAQRANMGMGWSHTYSGGISASIQQSYSYGPGGYVFTSSLAGYVVEPNGARIALSAASVPSAGLAHVRCTAQAGAPLLVDAYYNGSAGQLRFVVTYADRSQWTFLPNMAPNGPTNVPIWYAPVKIADRMGSYITLNYTAPAQGGYNLPPFLTSICDSGNVPLLSIARTPDYNNTLTSVTDRYGRSVYYHVGLYGLDHVSQIVPTGTASPPATLTATRRSTTTKAKAFPCCIRSRFPPQPERRQRPSTTKIRRWGS